MLLFNRETRACPRTSRRVMTRPGRPFTSTGPRGIIMRSVVRACGRIGAHGRCLWGSHVAFVVAVPLPLRTCVVPDAGSWATLSESAGWEDRDDAAVDGGTEVAGRRGASGRLRRCRARLGSWGSAPRPWPTPFLGCKTRARACVVHAQRTQRYVPCLSRGSWPPRGRPEEPAPKRATAPVGAAAAVANGDVALSVKGTETASRGSRRENMLREAAAGAQGAALAPHMSTRTPAC